MIKKIIDFFSISTAHHIVNLFSLAMIVLCLSIPTGLGIIAALFNLFALVLNLKFCFNQYSLLQRLREDLRDRDYDERLLEPFKQTICGRQIIRKILREKKGEYYE